MDGQRFDRITRYLTTGASRRRMLGALMGGTAVALGSPGRTLAQDKGNSQCAAFCHDLYDGREAGQCAAAAARNCPKECICAFNEANEVVRCLGSLTTIECGAGRPPCPPEAPLCFNNPGRNRCATQCPGFPGVIYPPPA